MTAVTAIGLYSSRIVLNALGTSDYGVYAVVASVTAILTFLNTSTGGATSRFIAFAIGRGDKTAETRHFSGALALHIVIAAVVVIISETAGMWFLSTKLSIPPDRASAARWLLQFATISTAATIIQTPYMATVIAREHMKTFAWIETLQSMSRLGAAILLLFITPTATRLMVYGAATAALSVATALAYAVCCRRRYNQCRVPPRFDASTIKPLLSFSALDIYGNLCVTARAQVIDWLINIFCGVVLNAAAAMASIANNAILGLATTLTSAFKPRAIKLYAAGDIAGLSRLITATTVISLTAMAFAAAPCFIEADFILRLWLSEVPGGTPDIFRAILVQSTLAIPVTVISVAIHATGDIKRLSFLNGTIYIAAVPAAWIALKCGAPAYWAYCMSAAATATTFFTTFAIARSLIPGLGCQRIMRRAVRAISIITMSGFITAACAQLVAPGWPRLITACAAYFTLCGCLSWRLSFSDAERHMIISFLRREQSAP